jgi:hypothetical protein
MSSKIPLGTGWRMGLLAQVPVKEETTTTLTHESGLGDATFQAFVAHQDRGAGPRNVLAGGRRSSEGQSGERRGASRRFAGRYLRAVLNRQLAYSLHRAPDR